MIKDGGPIYPTTTHGYLDGPYGPFNMTTINYPGMSLRDWFAGQNVQRIFEHHMVDGETTVEQAAKDAATWSYAIADAMLKEREK